MQDQGLLAMSWIDDKAAVTKTQYQIEVTRIAGELGLWRGVCFNERGDEVQRKERKWREPRENMLSDTSREEWWAGGDDDIKEAWKHGSKCWSRLAHVTKSHQDLESPCLLGGCRRQSRKKKATHNAKHGVGCKGRRLFFPYLNKYHWMILSWFRLTRN